MFATLDNNAKLALRVIRDKGVVSGWELRARTGLKPEELVDAVRTLLNGEMIASSGDPVNAEQVLEAYFNFRPSARALADLHLRFGAGMPVATSRPSI